MIDISKSFSQQSESLGTFYRKPGLGFYIPLYQREYSWDTENVEQLMEDLCDGVSMLPGTDADPVIHFLGTLILFQERNVKANIQPRDDKALPTRIDNVIDGQQRICTLSLLAALLYQRFHRLQRKWPAGAAFDELKNEIDTKKAILLDLFAVDIKRGKPTRKPIILRGSVDSWTFDGDIESYYKSDITNYLGQAVSFSQGGDAPKPRRKTRLAEVIATLSRWLDIVEEEKADDPSLYPSADQLLKKVPEEFIWTYARPELTAIVSKGGDAPERKLLERVIRLSTFTYFVVERCCFTVIQPTSEEWAFDMFQSLNATGTPLTAVETFKPYVVNKAMADGGFKGSKSETYFQTIDKLLGETNKAAKKEKLTDDFLTTFTHTFNGTTIPAQFSRQRKFLNDQYQECKTPAAREEFVRRMADLATYFEKVVSFTPNGSLPIEGLSGLPPEEQRLAALSILYLGSANHRMANTVLSRFYSGVLRSANEQAKIAAAQEFATAAKAVAAFYSLWRAARNNSGLDDVYRKLLRESFSWEKTPGMVEGAQLMAALTAVLKEQDLSDRATWLTKAKLNLKYDLARPVCYFALFVASHDTIPDEASPGLMKAGQKGSGNMLDPETWENPDFRTLEHIAPQKNDGGWDPTLYDDESYQKIGNLTMLPGTINTSIGNASWHLKSIYYRHLAEKDPQKLAALQAEATALGKTLSPRALELLQTAGHKQHMTSIVSLPPDGKWDKALVDSRTERICELLWDRVSPWVIPVE